MERLLISHDGIVTNTQEGRVFVRIQSVSACATCAAHGRCGFAESKDKTLEISTADWHQYHEGDVVTVHIDENRGLHAVWIAYLLPALLIIATVITLSLFHLPEWAVAVTTLLLLALYLLLLFLFRHRLDKKFQIYITPANS